MLVRRIISGGQTGADRGGLAAAVLLGLPRGGWIPRGFRTELGFEPWLAELGLKETPQSAYPPRTRLNVRDADGTLWFGNPHSPGGKLTLKTARQLSKPWFIVEWRRGWPPPDVDEVGEVRAWLTENNIQTLNVAGNRESSQPGIHEQTAQFLLTVIRV